MDDNRKLLLSDAHGIYLPETFSLQYSNRFWNIEDHDPDLVTIQAGPEAEYYWESWDAILDKAWAVVDGIKYTLYQEGDLFAVAWNEMADESESAVYFY